MHVTRQKLFKQSIPETDVRKPYSTERKNVKRRQKTSCTNTKRAIIVNECQMQQRKTSTQNMLQVCVLNLGEMEACLCKHSHHVCLLRLDDLRTAHVPKEKESNKRLL